MKKLFSLLMCLLVLAGVSNCVFGHELPLAPDGHQLRLEKKLAEKRLPDRKELTKRLPERKELLKRLPDRKGVEARSHVRPFSTPRKSVQATESARSAYFWVEEDGTTITFYYDDQYEVRKAQGITEAADKDITKIVIDESVKDYITDTWACLFYGYVNLTTIEHLDYLNTDYVTDMSYMFMNCESLTSLDLSSFNTENVTDMACMFEYCYDLVSLDLSSFNTSKVTDMACMFAWCSSLSSLDVSGFNTSNVTDMFALFGACTALESLDLRNFDVSGVTDMSYMFYTDWNLVTIMTGNHDWQAESGIDDGEASESMFEYCESLVGEKGTTYDAAHVTASYAHVDADGNPGYFCKSFRPDPATIYAVLSDEGKTMTLYFDNQKKNRSGLSAWNFYSGELYCSSSESESITKVVFDESMRYAQPTTTCDWFYYMTNLTTIEHLDYLNTEKVTDMEYMFGACSSLTSLDLTTFNTANVTTMYAMFSRCTSLTSLELCPYLNNKFITTNVTDMGVMFYECTHLAALDIRKFDTRNVESMYGMFYDCNALTALDVSGFNTEKVTDMRGMFQDCSKLQSLDLRNFKMQNVADVSWMFRGCSALTTIKCNDDWNIPSADVFYNCTSLVGGHGTAYNELHVSSAYANPDRPFFNGYFTATGAVKELYGVWDEGEKSLTVYYDDQCDSRGGSREWNNYVKTDYYKKAKKVIFDTSVQDALPTNTKQMFLFFEELESIEHLDYLHTDKVADMSSMFNGCTKLKAVDVSTFHTQNVISMEHMFSDCALLTTLDLQSFNTENVQNMSFMFSGCAGLSSLDIANFNTQNVTDMSYMFNNCSGLVSLGLGKDFVTDNVTDMSSMFQNCSSLPRLDLRYANTSKVTKFGFMFSECTSLTELNIRLFDVSATDYLAFIFGNCTSLTTIYCNNDWYQYVDQISPMPVFSGCSQLVGGNGSSCDGAMVFDDLIYATPDLAGHTGYFTNDEELYAVLEEDNTTLTLRYDKEKLLRGGVTDWAVYNNAPENPNKDVNNITKIVFDESVKAAKPTSCFSWFDAFEQLESIEHLDYLNTEEVTNMEYMFNSCEKLQSLDLSHFNTEKVTRMFCMFLGCHSLTRLNISSFNTANVTDMTGMFYACKELKQLNVNNFDLSNVEYTDYMFAGCSKLVSICCTKDWTTAPKLKSSLYMFNNSKSLVGAAGTKYNSNITDISYARLDDGLAHKGYFTMSYAVTIAAEHGTVTVKEEDVDLNNVVSGTVIHLTATPDEGYEFEGWTNYEPLTGLRVVEDITVTATFAPKKYIVTFMDYDNITVLGTVEVDYGKSASAPVEPTREGYTFAGWDKDITVVTSDMTVTATYTFNSYTVTLIAEHGTVTVTPLSTVLTAVPHGSILTLFAAADEHYVFKGWSDGVESTPRDLAVTSDTTITALFELITFTVTYLDWDLSVLGTEEVAEGSDAKGPETEPTREGYTFTGWSKPLTNITEDLYVQAVYTENPGTGVDIVESQKSKVESRKLLREGVLIIEQGGRIYDASGREIKN